MSKKNKQIIGIEIGNGELAIFQDQGSQVMMQVRQVPEGFMKEGRVADPEEMALFISNTVKNSGFKGKDCAIILPERTTYFRSISIAPMTEAELKLNLPYEFRDFVGDDGDKYFYDYAMDNVAYENDTAVAMDVFIGAVQKEAIESAEDVLKRAGMKLKVALPREMALVNLFREALENGADPNREYCLIEIGINEIHVYILKNAHIIGSKTINMGGRDVDSAIADIYGITVHEAMNRRMQNQDNILSAPECRAVFENIAVEVMKAINFHRFENPDSIIDEIYFCGSDSDLVQIKEEILASLQMREQDIFDILPGFCKNLRSAYKGIMSIGVTL